jgi:hypothetical protein
MDRDQQSGTVTAVLTPVHDCHPRLAVYLAGSREEAANRRDTCVIAGNATTSTNSLNSARDARHDWPAPRLAA